MQQNRKLKNIEGVSYVKKMYQEACRISVSWLEIEPGPQQWKSRILSTSPPGSSQDDIANQ